MERSDVHPELLSAYCDGEVNASERGRIEKWLERDAAARALLADLRRARAAVQGLPRERAPGGMADEVLDRLVRRQLLAGDAGPSTSRRIVAVRRLAVAAALLIGVGIGWRTWLGRSHDHPDAADRGTSVVDAVPRENAAADRPERVASGRERTAPRDGERLPVGALRPDDADVSSSAGPRRTPTPTADERFRNGGLRGIVRFQPLPIAPDAVHRRGDETAAAPGRDADSERTYASPATTPFAAAPDSVVPPRQQAGVRLDCDGATLDRVLARLERARAEQHEAEPSDPLPANREAFGRRVWFGPNLDRGTDLRGETREIRGTPRELGAFLGRLVSEAQNPDGRAVLIPDPAAAAWPAIAAHIPFLAMEPRPPRTPDSESRGASPVPADADRILSVELSTRVAPAAPSIP